MTISMKKAVFFIVGGIVSGAPSAQAGWLPSFFSKTEEKKNEEQAPSAQDKEGRPKDQKGRPGEPARRYAGGNARRSPGGFFGGFFDSMDGFFDGFWQDTPWYRNTWAQEEDRTVVPKNLKKKGEQSFRIAGIDALEIIGDDIEIQLIGEENTSTIKVEVYGEEREAGIVPQITQTGRRARMTIPASTSSSHKPPVYRISLPRDMDAFLTSRNLRLATKNMDDGSFLSASTQGKCSVYHKQESSGQGELSSSFSCTSSSHHSNRPFVYTCFGSGRTEEDYSLDALSRKALRYERRLERNESLFRFSSQHLSNLVAATENLRNELKNISTRYVQDIKAAFPSVHHINETWDRSSNSEKSPIDDFLSTVEQVEFLFPRQEATQKVRDEIMLNKEKRSRFLQLRKNLEKDMDGAFQRYEEAMDRLKDGDEQDDEPKFSHRRRHSFHDRTRHHHSHRNNNNLYS